MNEEQKKQMGKDCMELIIKKLSGDLNPNQYCDALILLHQKYPLTERKPPLTTFQLKNYKRIMQLYTDPGSGIKYLDHLQPWNFQEAAEMYYWHSRVDYCLEKEISEETKPIDRKMISAGDYPEEWDAESL